MTERHHKKSISDHINFSQKIKPQTQGGIAYVVLSFLASISFGISLILRSKENSNIYVTNYLISYSFFVCGIFYIFYQKFQAYRAGEVFISPWYTWKEEQRIRGLTEPLLRDKKAKPVYEFSGFVLLYFMLGGAFEFFGSLTLSASFYYGGIAKMNVGICAAMLSCNTVLILLVSRYVFMQRIQTVQVVGVLMLVLAVGMISIFKVLPEPVFGEADQELSRAEEKRQFYYQQIALASGLCASLLFGTQILMIKYLASVNVNGTNAAFYSCVFAGVMGIIGSVCTALFDSSFFVGVSWSQLQFTMLIGFFISFGQVFINMAVAKGNAAICAAILHTKTIYVVLFNWFFLGQALHMGQTTGIILVVVGSIIIRLGNAILCCK